MRGQQEAVSAILISGILIGVVGSVYFWGIPLIQKSRDVTLLENSEAFMKTLDEKIRAVASAGGRGQLTGPEGTLAFIGGQLQLTAATAGTIYATDADIALIGADCTTNDGAFGTDVAGVLCVNSRRLSEGNYETAYTLKYQRLVSGLKIFEIKLAGTDSSGGGDSTVIMTGTGTTTAQENGKEVVTSSVLVEIKRA